MPIQERYIDSDGNFSDGTLTISAQNRAFRYGDGVFETILVCAGKAVALDLHLQRMLIGTKILGFEPTAAQILAQARAIVEKLLKGQAPSGFGRMRLTAFRADGGLYRPSSNACKLVGEIHPLPGDPWEMQRPRKVVTAPIGVTATPLSTAKTLNALPYILAARHACDLGADDALLLSHTGELAELSASNIFVVSGGRLLTPHLSSGCLPGTMRARVLAAAQAIGLQASEAPLLPSDFKNATEVICSNAIQGLQPIGQIDEYEFSSGLVLPALQQYLLAQRQA